MNDMRMAIAPKSDQANYEDFIGGITKTIKITKVTIGKHEQPIAISYENDNGKPWKPCKSMARVLVHCWGDNANHYIGRSVTLYGDPNVVFGGSKVGGIRVSHLSHINEPVTIPLTTTRSIRKPFTVNPLMGTAAPPNAPDKYVKDAVPTPDLGAWLDDIANCPTVNHLQQKFSASVKVFTDDESRKKLIEAKNKRKAELTTNQKESTNDTK
jgi:hypothetical protein